MKQSTWRYFQRDSELPRRWKSTRRDATSGGLRELRAHRQRERGHRDAVRIVRVDDVGLELLDQRGTAATPRRGPSRCVGASGIRSSPPSRAGASSPSGMGHEHGAVAERAQAQHGDQHLVLTAAPRARRVDVEREHSGGGLRCRRGPCSGFAGTAAARLWARTAAVAGRAAAAPTASRTSGRRNTSSASRRAGPRVPSANPPRSDVVAQEGERRVEQAPRRTLVRRPSAIHCSAASVV